MYPKALLVAFLSLSLGVSAMPKDLRKTTAAADTCQTGAAVKTVTVTQTASAAGSSSTAILVANPNAGKGSGSGQGNTAPGAGKGTGQTGAGKGAGQTGAGKGAGQTGAGQTGAGKGAGQVGAGNGTGQAGAGNGTGQAGAGNGAGQAGGAKGGNNAAGGNAANGNQGNAGNAGGNQAAQTSLTIDPSNIFTFTQTGQETPTAGQEASITSTNNFINFCLTVPDKQKTNGQQIVDGSCNQTPMGVIAAQSKMPSAKFQNPVNGGTVAANQNFTVKLAINNLETGHFTNPATTFHMAPQQVNAQGLIKGHSHIVIEKLASLDQSTPTTPTDFVFFKGLNDVAQNGVLSTVVDGGLPAGTYRIATINSAANHQPALVAVAQRGSLDDMAYFTVTANGNAAGGAGNGAAGAGAGQAGGAAGAGAGAGKGAGQTGAGAGQAGAGAGQAGAGKGAGQAGAGAGAGAAAGAGAGKTGAKGNNNAAAAAAAAGNRKTGAKNRRRF